MFQLSELSITQESQVVNANITTLEKCIKIKFVYRQNVQSQHLHPTATFAPVGCIFVYALNCIKIGTAIELACGYGGSVGAMKAMGGDVLNLSDAELKQIVTDWRNASPHIVKFWWAVDDAIKTAIRRKTATETHGLRFSCQSGMLFITLPSGRKLCYAHPQIGENRFGGESVTYMGVGTSKKWERIESYGPKFVENIVQAVARDLLMFSMQTLSHCFIVGHIHDEMIIEADRRMSLEAVCRQMSRTPEWAKGLLLRADEGTCRWYQKV